MKTLSKIYDRISLTMSFFIYLYTLRTKKKIKYSIAISVLPLSLAIYYLIWAGNAAALFIAIPFGMMWLLMLAFIWFGK